jgi:hypothetical protein
VAEQFEVRFGSNDSDLSSPSKKRLPVAQQLVGPLGQVFSRGIAEIECQMSTDRMGNQIARDEYVGTASGRSGLGGPRCGLSLGRFCHYPATRTSNRLDSDRVLNGLIGGLHAVEFQQAQMDRVLLRFILQSARLVDYRIDALSRLAKDGVGDVHPPRRRVDECLHGDDLPND